MSKMFFIKYTLINLRLFFEPRDIWIGVYWKAGAYTFDIYICVLPMLPLHIFIARPIPLGQMEVVQK